MFYPFSYFRFDPTMIILIPAVILTIYAQSKVQSNFAKYLRVPTQKGYTGVQVARRLLDQHGLQNIPIELSRGKLSDHYDPTKQILRLSQEVYEGHSIAAVSVAAHEVGHAIQHANGYIPLSLRNMVYTNFKLEIATFSFSYNLHESSRRSRLFSFFVVKVLYLA